MPLWPDGGQVWIMGCGNMGGALLRCWLAQGLDPGRVTVIDPAPATIEGVKWQGAVPSGSPALLLFGVKPQIYAEAAQMLAGHVGQGTSVISILAGVECATLRLVFPDAGSIVRSMPNLPVSVGKGVTGLYSDDADDDVRSEVSALFAATGHAEWLDREDLFHAVIAVSGSGPAFTYRFISAIAQAGVELGLPKEQALRLACAMVEGAGSLAKVSGVDPIELARRVTSPGGTTAAGLAVLDQGGAFGTIVAKTLIATADRSNEMARESLAARTPT
jgi:pyrroline-5-carboxylate reductase